MNPYRKYKRTAQSVKEQMLTWSKTTWKWKIWYWSELKPGSNLFEWRPSTTKLIGLSFKVRGRSN